VSRTRHFRVIDGHAHVASMHFVPPAFVAGAASNIAAAGTIGPVASPSAAQIRMLLEMQYADHDADDMVRAMDVAGVARTVLLLPDFTHTLPGDLTIEEMALRHHRIRQRHPGRFYVFQGIDPRAGNTAAAFFESTIVNYGFEGLKLYPPCGYSPSDPRLFPFYEICREHGLPVLLHTGPTSPVLDFEFAQPALIDRAARLFPDVNFILAHGGVNNTEESALLCAYRPNVYLDFAGFPSALQPQGWKRHLAGLFSIGINHKIIFGTDWPLSGLTMSLNDCINELLVGDGPLATLPDVEIEAIMGGNIERLIPQRAQQAVQPSHETAEIA
jgi:uncharacterized protein